jgi:hypothetical protein
MKPLTLRLLVGVTTFFIGLCCTRVWPILTRPQSVSATIQTVTVAQPARISTVPFTESEILKTVFRYQMEHCYKGQPKPAFFLSYKGRDLSDEFLSNFASGAVPVQHRSQRRQFFVQRQELGIGINVNAIEFSKTSIVQVRCECGRGVLDGYSYSLRLKLRNDHWAVQRRQLIGVS